MTIRRQWTEFKGIDEIPDFSKIVQLQDETIFLLGG